MLKKTSDHNLQFNLNTAGWLLKPIQNQSISLNAIKPVQSGWYKLVITAKNNAAKEWMLENPSVLVYQNENTNGVPLLNEKAEEKSLVFYRHNELTDLRLSYQFDTTGAATVFSLRIKRILSIKAYGDMLKSVSRRQKAEGKRASHIYRITRARQKRVGWSQALAKLVRDYQPLLSHQLISCEPYQYWQSVKEPSLSLPPLVQQKTRLPSFNLILHGVADKKQLLKSIESVLSQSFSQWRLYICVSEILSQELQRFVQPDDRLIYQTKKQVKPDLNSHVIILQAGDLLAPDALRVFSAGIDSDHNRAECILYSDHDVLDSKGYRVRPQFKPDWNPDFFLSRDYIGPACAIPASLWQQQYSKPNWWQQSGYVLLLEAMLEQKKPLSSLPVVHLPYVLLHQFVKSKSAYDNETTKVIQALIKRLAETENNSVLNVYSDRDNNVFKLQYAISKPCPLVSLLIPTRDALQITRNCVESILEKTDYPNYEIIILDNQSCEAETLEWFELIASHTRVRILPYDHPFNYSAINNFGVREARGELIGLVNNDTEVINGNWLTEMVQHAARPEIGCVGAKLYYFDDTIQHAGVIMGLWGLAGHSHKNYLKDAKGYMNRLVAVQNLSAVTAACLVIKKELFVQIQGLDEHNLVVAFNDVDLCLKVQQAGYRNLWTPYAELYHYESKSRGKEDTPEKQLREKSEIDFMRSKWPEQTRQDPYYSPHLTHVREDFGIGIE